VMANIRDPRPAGRNCSSTASGVTTEVTNGSAAGSAPGSGLTRGAVTAATVGGVVDVDRYLAQHQASWQRLERLVARAGRGARSLSDEELDELLDLYQRTSAQLSWVRSHYQEPALTHRLNELVARANAVVYRRTASPAASFGQFFTVTFPAAVWHLRRFVAVSALVLFVPLAVVAVWFANSPEARDVAAPAAVREAYVTEDFEAYYSSEPAGQFATEVLVNNIQVSFLAFAVGIFFCIGTVALLAFNGANVGVALGLFAAVGEQPRFWGLILPHGLLELSAVVIAGAAGLSMGWALIAPGDRRRSAALTEEARRSVAVIIGLMLCFVTAAVIEAFVTPSGLPTAVRIGIGLAVQAAFTAYVVTFGRAAAARGQSGLLGEQHERRSVILAA
jgi:uncharacterized membrane protein SpoIIM required for sporulation